MKMDHDYLWFFQQRIRWGTTQCFLSCQSWWWSPAPSTPSSSSWPTCRLLRTQLTRRKAVGFSSTIPSFRCKNTFPSGIIAFTSISGGIHVSRRDALYHHFHSSEIHRTSRQRYKRGRKKVRRLKHLGSLKNKQPRFHPIKHGYIFLLPALCDMCATSLM